MTAEKRSGASSLGRTLVLYDGVCGLCNRLVAFLIRHDRDDEFRFAPLQGEVAHNLLARYHLDATDLDTVVVLADFQYPSEHALTRSNAVLWSFIRLGGIWKIFAVAKLLPFRLREALYRIIARSRYQFFAKYDACPLPQPEHRHKFL